MAKQLTGWVRIAAAFVVANLAVFTAYRAAFMASFTAEGPSRGAMWILSYGLRLDLALLGLELFLVALPAIVAGRWHPRRQRLALWILTGLHGLVCFANFQFFAERNQHLWEMLIANVTRPDEVYLAVAPFFYERSTLGVTVLIGSLIFIALTVWAFRRAPLAAVELRGPTRRYALVGILALFLLTNLEPVTIKKTDWPLGWVPLPTASQYYMRFDNYLSNQAVINPVHDLVRYYLPVNLAGLARFELGLQGSEVDLEWALHRTLKILGLTPTDTQYPLFREVSSRNNFGIRNVILIQVEGLSDSLVHHMVRGRPVMPYLRRLTHDALYFNNIFQSADATDGSIFSITTSLPKTFSELKTEFLLSYEVNGRYGGLPTILGSKTYHHYFMQGFRQRAADFVSFMGNQGYETHDFHDLEARLRGNHPSTPITGPLGVFDGAFLTEAAEILSTSHGPFTAYLVTSTSHSPWSIPEGTPAPFGDRKLDAFHYVDTSLKAFLEMLRHVLPDFDKTLIVIVADHTSVTFGSHRLERIHVPLFFYSPALTRSRARWRERLDTQGSHLDILPTVLDLLGGRRVYAGMGRSLLRGEAHKRGILSANRYSGLYLQDGFVLRYSPYGQEAERTRLYRVKRGRMVRRDVSEEQPEVLEQMRLEYLAQYETARQLTREKRVFPVNVVTQVKAPAPRETRSPSGSAGMTPQSGRTHAQTGRR
ncbi:MAG: LTA synthase family protein [Candidatus Binatia bacterium]